jgi:hypothetical protein
MALGKKYIIKEADIPQPIVGGRQTAFMIAFTASSSNSGIMKIGGKSSCDFVIQPGQTIAFDNGQADLAEGWYVQSTVTGDSYEVLAGNRDVQVFQAREREAGAVLDNSEIADN